MIPTTQVLRVLFVEPSARDVQLVGEILHETTTRLPGSYVFDVVRSNFGALERVSRSEYRLVCVAEDSKSALHGRMAAKLLRRSCPDLSVTLVLDGKAKEPPPPKATRTGAKSKRSSSSPSSSRSASPSSSTGSGIFQTSSLPRKSSSSSSSSSSSTLGKGCSSGGACWGPRPGAGGRGVGFCGGGGFAAGFWPDGGVAAGGGSSGGGNVECEGVAGGTGGEVAGGRQREERIAGGGGGAGGGRERGPSSSSPSLSIPSSSPRPRLTSSLETDLEVVDYVLKRPFSDETFRLLLEATESDHRRVSAPTCPFEPRLSICLRCGRGPAPASFADPVKANGVETTHGLRQLFEDSDVACRKARTCSLHGENTLRSRSLRVHPQKMLGFRGSSVFDPLANKRAVFHA
ncbi:unnamed protein product [Scytosiphon promiscuus]